MRRLLLLALLALPTFAQGIRIDPTPALTTAGNPPPGGFPLIYAVPGAKIALYTNPTLTSIATAYTDQTLGTTCPGGSPVVAIGTATCTQFSGPQGQFGFWVPSGTYYYTITIKGNTYGPYTVQSFGPAGGYTYDANYTTLPLACNAATSGGTLVVSRAWTGIITQTFACKILFYGVGSIQPASGQTVTISGFDCPQTAQCFDASLGGTFVFPARSTITPNNFGAVADGRGASGTDYSTQWNYANSALSNSGGGSLFIPRATACYWAQNVILYSNITIYSDSRSTCVQKPAGTTAVQMFTTANGQSGPGTQPVSNIDIHTLTLDGNKANQTFSPGQDGIYAIYLGGCSNCSITDTTQENFFTDGTDIGGYGLSAYTGTVNTAVQTVSVSTAAYSSACGCIIYTTSAPHGIPPAARATPVIIAGIIPSGYNFASGAPCNVLIISTTQFSCSASNPGAYVSGGTVTDYMATSVSGTNFSFFGSSLTVTINGVDYGVVHGTDTTAYLGTTTNPGNQSGVSISWNGYTGVGDNVQIAYNLITKNGRNGLSFLGGTNINSHDNEISYSGFTDCSGQSPEVAWDLEPFTYGAFLGGFKSQNNYIHDDCVGGGTINMKVTWDPNFNPVVADRTFNEPTFGFSGTTAEPVGSLRISGEFGNDGDFGVVWNGFPLVSVNQFAAYGETDACIASDADLSHSSIISNGTCNSISGGGGFDLSAASPTYLGTGVILPNATTNGAVNVWSPLEAQVSAGAIPNGLVYWPGTNNERDGKSVISSYCTVNDAQPNPGLFCSNLIEANSTGAWSSSTAYTTLQIVSYMGAFYIALQGSTNQTPSSSPSYWAIECIARSQALTNNSGIFGTETNCPAVFGSNNATTGAAGSITIQAVAGKTILNVVDLPTSSSGLATGTLWNNSGVINTAP